MRSRIAIVGMLLSVIMSGSLGAQTVVVDEGGYWRRYLCFARSRYSAEALKSDGPKVLGRQGYARLERDVKRDMQGLGLDANKLDWREHAYLGNRGARAFVPFTTPAPPTDWMSEDFDDRAWPRLRHPFQGGRQGKVTNLGLGQYESDVDMRLASSFYRTRFVVDDPAKTGTVTLSLSFVGGARAFVNGQEIGRAHLPAGDIDFDARAEDYPPAAYQKGGEAKQLRKLSVRVPADALRKGVNVLAVEIRGSDMHPVVAMMPRQPNWGTARPWTHCRLIEAKLRATGSGVTNELKRPAGVQVWAADLHRRIRSDDFLPPGESPGILRIVAAKNGAFAAQLVVGTDHTLKGLKLTVGALAGPGGKSLDASAVRVRWPRPYPANLFDLDHTHDERGLAASFPSNAKLAQLESPPTPTKVCIFDHLVDAPPASVPAGTSQPAWLSFRIPADAAPGTYRGTVTLSADGMDTTTLPVEVEVADWTLPDPKDFRTFVGCEENPWAVAKQYGVKPWSDEHFKLIEASFARLGRIGNAWLNVPVLLKSEFGNLDDAMVRWVRKRDGTYDADFSVFDRYLDVAMKHCGKPRAIIFVVMHGMRPQDPNDNVPTVLCRDEKTGKSTPLIVGGPKLSRAEKSERWTPFARAVVAHLKEKGLEKSLYWGYPLEAEADPELKDILLRAAPGVGWIAGPHEMMANGKFAKNERYYRIVADIRYHGGWPSFRDDMGWKSKTLHLLNPRVGGTAFAVHTTSLPFAWRVLPERALSFGRGGFTRVGVDDWGSLHYSGMVLPRWLTGIPVLEMFWPGKDGAESSIRYEVLLEGIQETEARIAIEQALDRGAGGASAAKAKRMLDRRVDDTRYFLGNSIIPAFEEYDFGWQERSAALYRLAAQMLKR